MIIRGGQLRYKRDGQETVFAFKTDKRYGNDDININVEIIKTENKERYIFILNPKAEIQIKELYLEASEHFTINTSIFLNGYQSWTESREFSPKEKIKPLRMIGRPFMKNYGDYTIHKYSGREGMLHSYTYTYIRRDKQFTLCGSLSEREGYTIFNYNTKNNRLRISKDCSGVNINSSYRAFDIFLMTGSESEVFDEYFNDMGIKRDKFQIYTGWTSWYNYYTKINENFIIKNLMAFEDNNIPIDIFQVDDGYEGAVGDWLDANEKFPNGMKYISYNIKKRGYKAGIWLAPFICERESKLFKEHQDWILKDDRGNFIKAGYNPMWSGSFYALDIYNEEFRSYLREVFHTVLTDWGYDMVKLDFLYAAAIVSQRDKSRGQIMQEAIDFLKGELKDKIILGCGVPLGQGFGIFDFCRIGGDVGLDWENNFHKFLNYRERVSTINSIKNSIQRRELSFRGFINDTDVFILREKNNKLSKEQRFTLLLTNLIFGGLAFTSDNIGEYSDEEFKLYLSIFPHRNKRIKKVVNNIDLYKVEFEIDNMNYIAYINTSPSIKTFKLKEELYFNFKDGFILGGENVILNPYESKCYLMVKRDAFNVAGSFNNIFPGAEVTEVKAYTDTIDIQIDKRCKMRGELYITIPEKCTGYCVNNIYFKSERVYGINMVKMNIGIFF